MHLMERFPSLPLCFLPAYLTQLAMLLISLHTSALLHSFFKSEALYSLVQRHPWENKRAQADAADGTQGNLLHLHTAEHDEVIFADQEGLVCE